MNKYTKKRRNEQFKKFLKTHNKKTLLALAHEQLEKCRNIPNFAYSGELDLGGTWAFCISTHRDADLMDVSNYETILEDLKDINTKHVEETNCNHWAVGWVKHITVKMLHNGKLTNAGKRLLFWNEQLNDYPLADDDDFYERESQQQEENHDYYKDEFANEVLNYLGCDVSKKILKRKQLDHLTFYIYASDAGYRGLEDAWVSVDSIERFIKESCYSDWNMDQDNCWLMKLLASQNKVA